MTLTMGLRILALSLAGAAMAGAAAAEAVNGQQTFVDNCSACHQVTGLGIKGAFPALAGDKFVVGPVPIVASTVLNGRAGMPSFKNDLSDAQIAAALTYVRSSWGNKAAAVKPTDVAAARKAPPMVSSTPGALRH